MKEKRKNSAKLTTGPVMGTLVSLALPMMVGIVGMVAFNLVDTFFVGRLGTLQLAAMSFTFPVVLVVSCIARGLGVGVSSVLARAIGAGDHHRIQRLTTDGLVLSLLVVSTFVIAGLFTIEPLFRLLGAGDDIMPLIKTYMSIWYWGMPFVVIPMVGNNAIRATGDTRTPSMIMVVAILINMVLDPLLIFGPGPFPRLELAGAAIATVIARAVTLVVSLLVLWRREKMLSFEMPRLQEVLESWKRILFVGIPAAGTLIIIPLATAIVTRLVSAYGVESVAGFGVASRIEMFSGTPVIALSTVIIPFIGQNLGAGKMERIQRGLKYSRLFALLWGLVLLLVFLVSSRFIAAIFNNNSAVIEATSLYLLFVSVSYGALGVFQLISSAFNALNKPLHAAGLSILRVFVLYVPLAALGSSWFGLKGIFAAATLANLVVGVVSYFWMRGSLKTLGCRNSSIVLEEAEAD